GEGSALRHRTNLAGDAAAHDSGRRRHRVTRGTPQGASRCDVCTHKHLALPSIPGKTRWSEPFAAITRLMNIATRLFCAATVGAVLFLDSPVRAQPRPIWPNAPVSTEEDADRSAEQQPPSYDPIDQPRLLYDAIQRYREIERR